MNLGKKEDENFIALKNFHQHILYSAHIQQLTNSTPTTHEKNIVAKIHNLYCIVHEKRSGTEAKEQKNLEQSLDIKTINLSYVPKNITHIHSHIHFCKDKVCPSTNFLQNKYKYTKDSCILCQLGFHTLRYFTMCSLLSALW